MMMQDFPTIDAIVSSLGIAVLRFLWQGALIGLLAFGALSALRRGSAATRYALGCAAMACCAGAFVWTFTVALASIASTGGIVKTPELAIAQQLTGGGVVVDTVAWIWIGGVIFFAVRFWLQWFGAQRLRTTGVQATSESLASLFESLKREMGIRRAVRLIQSTLAESPMVVGWLAPAVLIPASSLASLTPDQLRAILVHELAHIRRHDHWINAAQVAIETVLFFHPVVWWLSGRMRLEREHCCDDAAVHAIGSPRILAEALAQLESHRHTHTQAALAANGGILMSRINRILGVRTNTRAVSTHWRTFVAIAAGAVVSVAGIANAVNAQASMGDPTVEVLREAVRNGTISQTDARAIYDAIVLPNSETQRRVVAEIEQMNRHLDEAIAAGKLSAEDADAKRIAMEDGLRERAEVRFSVEVLEMSRWDAHLTVTQNKLDRLVEAGEITREEADRKVETMLHSQERHNHIQEHSNQIALKIDKAVAEGKITAEEGRAKMLEVHRDIETRREAEVMALRLHELVLAGEITPEEAHEKIAEIKSRAEISDQLAVLSAEIKEQVVSGDLTEEEARRKMHVLRLGHAESEVQRSAKGTEIRAAVEAGELTPEEGRERMEALHNGMKMRTTLAEAEREIKEAVKAGKMTREEARAKLEMMHAKRAAEAGKARERHVRMESHDTDVEGTDRAHSDAMRLRERSTRNEYSAAKFEWEAVQDRIENAVNAGDMTREQANMIYKDLKIRVEREKAAARKEATRRESL